MTGRREIHAEECQCEKCEALTDSDTRFMADRIDTYRAAHALMKSIWGESAFDPQDTLNVAEFIAGDSLPVIASQISDDD